MAPTETSMIGKSPWHITLSVWFLAFAALMAFCGMSLFAVLIATSTVKPA